MVVKGFKSVFSELHYWNRLRFELGAWAMPWQDLMPPWPPVEWPERIPGFDS